MLWVAGRTKPEMISALAVALAFFLAFSSALAGTEENGSSNASAEIARINLTENEGLNTTQISRSQPSQEIFKTHVYVSNKDNDGLDVSLFIDSQLKETKDVSSDSEEEFDVYSLTKGLHSFKISWWDEDAKKAFETEEIREIEAETSINLYTTENEAPDKYELSVELANENENDLKTYLYIDGSFEKSASVSKESTSNIGEVELEEGVHELSVKWQDPDTNIEYEKRNRITVVSDDVVIFRAPKGVSFEAGTGRDLEQTAEIVPPSAENRAVTETSSDAPSDNPSETYSDTKPDDKAGDVSNDAPQSTDDLLTTQTASEKSDLILPSARAISAKSGTIKVHEENTLYIYAAVVIFAIYLLFFRR